MADTQVSDACEGNLLWVQIPFPAPNTLVVFFLFDTPVFKNYNKNIKTIKKSEVLCK